MSESLIAPYLHGIGDRQVRLEDAALLTGEARYAADLVVEGVTHAAFVRSQFAHARITSIDSSAAEAVDGVIAVLTCDDLGLEPMPLPGILAELIPAEFQRRPLALDTVRFVGESIAVVIAETAAIAADAAELVTVDYDPLPPVVDAHGAVAHDSPLLFPSVGTNVAMELSFEGGTQPDDGTVVVHETIANHRMAVAPMECSAIVVVPEPATRRITAFAATQMPHMLRDAAAAALRVDASDVDVVAPAVGGSFGGKGGDSDVLVVMAVTRRLGRPVRYVQTRTENILTSNARGHWYDVTLRATSDGRVTSVEVDSLTNAGAYPSNGCALVLTTRALVTGAYDIPHVQFDLRCVATNTSPIGPFRGAGRPEAAHIIERGMDMLAAELGIDPVELRRRNLLRSDQFPYATVTGLEYDSGEYRRCLDEALRLADYDGLRQEQRARRERGDTRHLGIGVSFYVEISAAATMPGVVAELVLRGGSSEADPRGGAGPVIQPIMNTEYAAVEVKPDGRVLVTAGTSDHGQGHQTTYAQIIASTLGIPADRVDLVDGDTRVVAHGNGSGGSRTAQVGGSVVMLAADDVLTKAKQIAARMLEADVADIALGADGLIVQGVPASTVSWADLAAAANDTASLPDGMEPGLDADRQFTQTHFGTAPFGCHIAVVEVDGETGEVELVRMIAVDDCGVVISPLLAEGQVHGGLLGGIAQALFEEIVFDDDGTPLTPSFAQYGFPSAAELPSYETSHTETPSPNNPLGAKGLGEAGTTGSLPAVHNAVVDAVAHLGIRHVDMPLTPMRVWAAIREATTR